MNNISEIKTIVINIINENVNCVDIQYDQINDDLSILGMDSLTFIKIVVVLEETFNIEIPDELLLVSKMNTISKIIEIVSSILMDKRIL